MAVERINATAVHSQSTPGYSSTPPFSWVSVIQDGLDSTFIRPAGAGHFIRYNFAAPVVITAMDTINFIAPVTRAAKTGGGTARFRARQLDALSNFQDGTNNTLGTGFADHADNFPLTPTGGAWTLADFTGLTLQLNCLIFPAGFTMDASEFYIDIDYTPPAPPVTGSSRSQSQNGNQDPLAEFDLA